MPARFFSVVLMVSFFMSEEGATLSAWRNRLEGPNIMSAKDIANVIERQPITEKTRVPNDDVPNTVEPPLGVGLKRVLHDLHSMSKENFLDILGLDFQGDLNRMSYEEILDTLEKVEIDRKEVRKDFDLRQRSASQDAGIGEQAPPTNREQASISGQWVPTNGVQVSTMASSEQAATKEQIPTPKKGREIVWCSCHIDSLVFIVGLFSVAALLVVAYRCYEEKRRISLVQHVPASTLNKEPFIQPSMVVIVPQQDIHTQ